MLIGLKREVLANTIKIPKPTIGTNHDGIGPCAEVIKEYGYVGALAESCGEVTFVLIIFPCASTVYCVFSHD